MEQENQKRFQSPRNRVNTSKEAQFRRLPSGAGVEGFQSPRNRVNTSKPQLQPLHPLGAWQGSFNPLEIGSTLQKKNF